MTLSVPATASSPLIDTMAAHSKKILFVIRQAPHGNTLAQEALDILLMASSFEHEISLLFLEDGVFGLCQQQDTTSLGIQNFTSAYKALALYDIQHIYLAEQDMNMRGLALEDLMISPLVVNEQTIQSIMQQHDIIFNV